MRVAVTSVSARGAGVLQLADIEQPPVGPGEVCVRVHTSGINPT